MSSSDLSEQRKFTNRKFQAKLNQLAKIIQQNELNKLVEQVDKPDILQSSETLKSAMGFHGINDASIEMRYQKIASNKNYYYSLEPDLDKCQVLFFGNKFIDNEITQSQIQDYSFTGKTINVYGSPYRKDSGFDLGYSDSQFKSWSMVFNSPFKKDGVSANPTVNQEHIEIVDHPKLQHVNVGAGISIFMRIKPLSFANQASFNPTLMCKVDDPTATNAKTIRFDTTGKLQFSYKIGATQHKKQTVNSFTLGNWMDIWTIYQTSGNVTSIYVNNVSQSTTTPSDLSFPSSASQNMQILRRSSIDSGGHVNCEIHYMVIFVNKVVNATEINNHWTNKLSITNIPFGSVGIYDQSVFRT